MSDEERLLALLHDFGVSAVMERDELEDEETVALEAHHGAVLGHQGFRCTFTFNLEGGFRDVGVWE